MHRLVGGTRVLTAAVLRSRRSLSTDRPKLWILFGSSTGTAESYARMLGPQAVTHGFDARVAALNDVLEEEIDGAIACVVSTAGNGELPRNAERFYNHLSQKNVKGVPYSILGLGDSTHEHFNAAAKALDRAFRDAGATSAQKLALSCETIGSHDASYREWKRGLWKALGTEDTTASVVVYACDRHGVREEELPTQGRRLLDVPAGFHRARVVRNDVLSAARSDPVYRKLTFALPVAKDISEEHCEVLPRNGAALVTRACRRLGEKPGEMVTIRPLEGAPRSPLIDGKQVAVGTIMAEVIDVSGVPSRSFLEGLSAIATDPKERAALDDLANDLSAHSEYDRLTHAGFSLIDALERFPKLDMSLEYVLSYAPRITPRTYSLATAQPSADALEICFNDPVFFKQGDKIYHGLTSHMMAGLEPESEITVALKKGNKFTPQAEKPLCIVALGTGVSSARALLQARRTQDHSKVCTDVTKVDTILFYGFRHKGQDDLFAEEFQSYVDEGWLEVRKTASHDQQKFVTPIDAMDASLGKFLSDDGQFCYFGLGGQVPHFVEMKLRQIGVDVASLRATKRYHEEAFSKDIDVENLLTAAHKGLATEEATSPATTLAGRIGRTDMFCFQCEQTWKGTGCQTVGVCGKTPRVAALQDLLLHKLKVLGFYANEIHAATDSSTLAHAHHVMLHALFSTLTNVNFDESRFVDMIKEVHRVSAELKAMTSKQPTLPLADSPCPTSADSLVALGREVGVLERFGDPSTQSSEGVREMLTYGVKGIAAYAAHSLVNGREDPAIYEFLCKALAFLATTPADEDLATGLGLCLEAGKTNVGAMSLLYESHASTLGVPSPHDVSLKPRRRREDGAAPKGTILVSGHDLIVLQKLLQKADPLGIDVYTHGEMLPAHSYPKLRESPSLAGHFGGAWQRQSVEFPHFQGPVLVTTNCLTEPHDTYSKRLFTAGQVGWNGVYHLGDDVNNDDKFFDPLLKAALDLGVSDNFSEFRHPDPVGQQQRPATLRVGYGHEEIIQNLAGPILAPIKSGEITRFYLIGGCDGFEGHRAYYTSLVKSLPKTSVVLTLGCGKYRINHLDIGTIGKTGVPRILDVGQCNDAFSAIQVASALANALNVDLADLPLSVVLSWFEQKAVAVLLSCLALGIKPIHIGPALPAFVTPDVLDKLVTDFGILPIGDPQADAKAMASAKRAS